LSAKIENFFSCFYYIIKISYLFLKQCLGKV